jgi:hypothetical protein
MYYALAFLAGAVIATAGCWIFLVSAMDEIEDIICEAAPEHGNRS